MIKQINWPRFTEQYEDIKEHNQTVIPVTKVDDAWDWINHLGPKLVSAFRHLFRKTRQVKR